MSTYKMLNGIITVMVAQEETDFNASRTDQVPVTVTSKQFQLALNALGYFTTIQTKLISATTAQQVQWNSADIFSRTSQFMLDVVGTSLTSGQLDAVFVNAKGQ